MTFNDDDNVWGKSCGGRREFVLLENQWKFGIDGLSFWWKLIGGAYEGQGDFFLIILKKWILS